MSLYRLLKMAEAVCDSGDETAIKQMEAQFNGYVKKYCVAHYRPHNDGRTPNPWRRNMDYAPWENSPYYGSIAEFLEKFPGGIADWRKWREKTKKERNQAWSEGPTKGEMGLKKASIQERMKRINELTGIEKVAKGDLREELADLEHEQWMKWAKDILKSEDISKDRAKRWKKECFKPYDKLSEEMKDFDREWADKVLKIVEKHKGVEKKASNQVVVYISRALSIPERYLNMLTDLQLKDIKILVDLGKIKEARGKYTEYQIQNSRTKKAHYVPVGPDDVKKLEKEPHLYSDEGLEENKSIEEFREKTKSWRENSASDMAKDSVKEFLDYWKLLLKVPERRKKGRGGRRKK